MAIFTPEQMAAAPYGTVGVWAKDIDDRTASGNTPEFMKDGQRYTRTGAMAPGIGFYDPLQGFAAPEGAYRDYAMQFQEPDNFADAIKLFAGTVLAPIGGHALLGGGALSGAGATAAEAGGTVAGGGGGSVFGGSASDFLNQFANPQGGFLQSEAGMSFPTGQVTAEMLAASGSGAAPYAGDAAYEISGLSDLSSRNAATALNGRMPTMLESLQQLFQGGMSDPKALLSRLATTALGRDGEGGGGNGNGWLGSALSIGSGLYGLGESRRLRQLAEASGRQADPFGQYRAGFGNQLQSLWADPSRVTQLPGYEAGLQAVQRSMAAQGYQGSGNMMLALQKYGGDFFNNAVNQLGSLAGAQFNPASGAQLNMQGQQGATDLASRSLASIGYGARGQDTLASLLARLAG